MEGGTYYLALFLLVLFFWGEPDLKDRIDNYLEAKTEAVKKCQE